jgi:cytochrome c-type biogenesis protein CcmF
MNIGNIALVLALLANLAALWYSFAWARGNAQSRIPALISMGLAATGVVLASAFHLSNLLTHQFQFEYVRNFSERALPSLLLAASFWGGQAGSFLLWALWSALFALVLWWGLRRSAWAPFVLTPYLLITFCITAITLASGPFVELPDRPADGNGLNPLLQNYWMAIHPPILFTGFTTMAGPFVFAVAALWRRDYDGWVPMAGPWTLLAWACMGTGLALGGFWAYESLGWGGFWGWDPVENSSLVPWLFASALLHGLVLQGARGSLKRSNLLLAITGYLSVIYSTFLTRSGILGNFSIHSFVELGLMNYLLAFIAIFSVIGLGMLGWRWNGIGRRVIFSQVLSREFSLLICVLLFVAIMLIVLLGTSMPVISALPVFRSRFSVDMGMYGPMIAPFAFVLVLTMAVGPLLGWQSHKYGSLLKLLRWPAILSAVALFVCLLLNIVYPVALLFVVASVFATATNAAVIVRIWRAGPLRLGGYLCHVGVGLLFVGIIGTNVYKQTAALQLIQGEPQSVFGRQFVFRDIVLPPDDELKRTAMLVEVMDPASGSTWTALMPYYVYPKTGALIAHPDIEAGWWSDLYLAPSQYIPSKASQQGLLQLEQGKPQQIGGYTLVFQQFVLPDREAMMAGQAAEVQAVVSVLAPDGSTSEARPVYRVSEGSGQPVGIPASIADGVALTITGLDPTAKIVELQVSGLNAGPVNPDDLKSRVFIEVSQEPGIKLVWGGISIGVMGGLLALVRRWREARPADMATSPAAPVHGARPQTPAPLPTMYSGLLQGESEQQP